MQKLSMEEDRTLKTIVHHESPLLSSQLQLQLQSQLQLLSSWSRRLSGVEIDRSLRQHISKNLGSEWKEIGRNLGISDQQIDDLRDEGSNKESAYQLLRKWTEQAGSSATHQRLANALREAGRADLAEYVQQQGNQKLQKILGLKSTFDLSEHLDENDALTVAEHHNLPNQDIQDIKESDNPGATCIKKLMSRKIITPSDFSGLDAAVEKLKSQKIKEYLKDFVPAGIGKDSTKDDPSSVNIKYLEFAEKLDKKTSLELSFQFEFSGSDQDRIRDSMNPGVTFIRMAALEKCLFPIGDFNRLEASLKRRGVTLDVHPCLNHQQT